MAEDYATPVRRAVLTHMKADDDFVAIVLATQQHPQTAPANPIWPFTRYGVPIATPIRAACVDSATISFVIHSFAKNRLEGDRIVESAEDYAGRIASGVNRCLGGAYLDLGDGVTARIRWLSSQVMQDGAEAGAYHGVSSFSARVIG